MIALTNHRWSSFIRPHRLKVKVKENDVKCSEIGTYLVAVSEQPAKDSDNGGVTESQMYEGVLMYVQRIYEKSGKGKETTKY